MIKKLIAVILTLFVMMPVQFVHAAKSVTAIDYKPRIDYSYTEYTSGEYRKDDTGKKYYHYNLPKMESDDQLIIKYNDNTKETLVYDDASGAYLNDNVEVKASDVSFEDTQDTFHWSHKNTDNNYFIVVYKGITKKVPVSMKENKVVSIDYEPADSYSVYQDVNGKVMKDSKGKNYFHYSLPSIKDKDCLTVKYVNGTNRAFYYDASKWYYKSNEEIIKLSDLTITDQQSSKHWTVKGDIDTNFMELTYMGKSVKIHVNVKNNPVVSIDYMPIKRYNYYENTNGRISNKGYVYDLPEKETGDQLILEYRSGSRKIYTLNSSKKYYVSDTGKKISSYNVDISSDQKKVSWKVNGTKKTNYVVVKYHNRSTNIYVNVKENPLLGIKYEPCVVYSYKIGESYEVKDSKNKTYLHYETPVKKIGDRLVLIYKNGTNKTYVLKTNTYVAKDGDTIPSYDVSFNDNQSYNHWIKGGNIHSNYIKVSYMNKSCKVFVNIKEDTSSSNSEHGTLTHISGVR